MSLQTFWIMTVLIASGTLCLIPLKALLQLRSEKASLLKEMREIKLKTSESRKQTIEDFKGVRKYLVLLRQGHTKPARDVITKRIEELSNENF